MTENHTHSAAPARKLSGLALLACLATSLGLAGCGSMKIGSVNPANWLTPYRIDVIQGNFVSKEQVEALKAGMTREQVKEVLGTPLLASLFHADRWDYVFTLKRQGVEPQAFKYTVFFKGDQVARFEGDTMPSEAEFIATLANARTFGKPPVLQATDEQLKAAERPSVSSASVTPANTPANAAQAGSVPTVYPPLESTKQ